MNEVDRLKKLLCDAPNFALLLLQNSMLVLYI